MIFIVSKDLRSVEKAGKESFVGLNLWERQHIEEWIRKAPDILDTKSGEIWGHKT